MPLRSDRGLKSLADDVRIAFQQLRLASATTGYLARLAREQGVESLFVLSDTLLPAGTVLAVQVRRQVSPQQEAIDLRTLAVVRWRSRWPGRRGMALDVVELDPADRAPVSAQLARDLTTTPVVAELPPGRAWSRSVAAAVMAVLGALALGRPLLAQVAAAVVRHGG